MTFTVEEAAQDELRSLAPATPGATDPFRSPTVPLDPAIQRQNDAAREALQIGNPNHGPASADRNNAVQNALNPQPGGAAPPPTQTSGTPSPSTSPIPTQAATPPAGSAATPPPPSAPPPTPAPTTPSAPAADQEAETQAAYESSKQGEREKVSKSVAEARASATGPCSSSSIALRGGEGSDCATTSTIITTIDVVDLVTEKVGTKLSEYQGAEAVANVEKEPTNMAEYYQQASELYDKQAGINTGQSAIDAAAAIVALSRKSLHGKHKDKFADGAKAKYEAGSTSFSGTGSNTAKWIANDNDNLRLDTEVRTDAAEEGARRAKNEARAAGVKGLAGAAAAEQSEYGSKALDRMMKSALKSAQQISMAVVNADQARKQRKERDKYSCPGNKRKNDDDTCPAPEPDPGSGDTGPNGELITDPNGTSNGDARAPGGGIMPDGNMSVSKAVADDSEHKTDGAPAGGGVANLDTPQGTKASGPEAGTFKEGNGGAPAGGGGGGAANVAGTGAAAEVSGGDPGSTSMAAEAKGGGYAASEGGGGGGYSGGGSASSAISGGPDINELLAGLLPKKEQEVAKNGILQFATRDPASGPPSMLDARTNIFDRLHSTYLDKHKRGIVGVK